MMIISFSGRKGSGKTTLTKELISRGFSKISFADKLKEILADLYSVDLEKFYCPIAKDTVLNNSLIWDEKIVSRICEITGLNIPFEGVVKFKNLRQALQFVGTDVLRKYQHDFHISSIKNKLSPGVDYVLDDVRFKNEYTVLDEFGAIQVFVIRPYNFDYSNHQSEIELSRKDFKYVLMNDRSEHHLMRKANMFFDFLLMDIKHKKRTPFGRDEFIDLLEKNEYDTNSVASHLGCSRDKVVWWATKFCIPLIGNRKKYSINHNCFSEINEQTAYQAGLLSADGAVKKHKHSNGGYHHYLTELTSTDLILVKRLQQFVAADKPIYSWITDGKERHSLTLSSPYIVEDLKLWEVFPCKSKYNLVPEVVKNDEKLLNAWVVGLIDGDGSIFHTSGGKSVTISVIASEQVIDFLREYYNFNGRKYTEKNIDNLFKLNYHGKFAVEFYKRVYNGIGLARKWNKVKPFINKIWHH